MISRDDKLLPISTDRVRRTLCFLLAVLALAACTEASAYRVDYRTFRIEGPGVPGGSDAPDRRIAGRLCPEGYRILDKFENRAYHDEPGSVSTNWTIRCL